jgi:hypothetical protein
MMSEFSAPNLMSLHPPLVKTGRDDCDTCFTTIDLVPRGADIIPSPLRGLTSIDEYKARMLMMMTMIGMMIVMMTMMMLIMIMIMMMLMLMLMMIMVIMVEMIRSTLTLLLQ